MTHTLKKQLRGTAAVTATAWLVAHTILDLAYVKGRDFLPAAWWVAVGQKPVIMNHSKKLMQGVLWCHRQLANRTPARISAKKMRSRSTYASEVFGSACTLRLGRETFG